MLLRSSSKLLLIFFSLLFSVSSIYAQSDDEKKVIEFIVKFKSQTISMSNFIERVGAKSNRKLQVEGNFYKISFEVSQQSSQQLIDLLQKQDEVLYAEPNYKLNTFYQPEDQYFETQWAILNDGGDRGKFKVEPRRGGYLAAIEKADTGVGRLWKERPEVIDAAKDVLVAVIDTGIDLKHPDLKDNIYKNLAEYGDWEPANDDQRQNAPKNCRNKWCNNIDDDQNGYVDDYIGYSWVKTASVGYEGQGMDDNGHGTHVAGIIGAKHNDEYIAGINNSVRLLPLKFLNKKGGGNLEHALEAIEYSIMAKADVINASWGSVGYARSLHETVDRASEAGILFVAAAGNSGLDISLYPHMPASFNSSGQLTVSASNALDLMAYFSNFSRAHSHVFAPGLLIMSTYRGKERKALSGTSMAAPQVAGIGALLIGLYPEKFKKNPQALREYIIKTGDRSPLINNLVSSGSRVNAYNAAKGIIPAGNDEPDQNNQNQWIAMDFDLHSDHPYANDEEKTYEIHIPGAKWIRVHFGRHYLESHKDYVGLYDSESNLYDALSGFGKSYKARAVRGETIKLILKSDEQFKAWGFEVTHVEYIK